MTKQILPTTLQPGAEAALFWIGDQLLFQCQNEGAQLSKFVSPAAVRQAFVNEPVDSGWLPAGVNRWGQSTKGTWMLRWNAPAVYSLRLAGQARALRVPMPALLWFGQGNKYYIFAMRGKTFKPNGDLYHAPLANVNNAGLICFGRNEHPDVRNGGFDAAWKTFWEAPFNDDHSSGKSKQCSSNINDLLRSMARQRYVVYPEKDLVAGHSTLEGALHKLTRRGGQEWD